MAPDDGRPLAFLVKVKGALRIAAVDQRARALGLAPGLAFADARARVPALASEALDEGADAAWLTRLAEGCDRYTPMVALDPPGGLILDVTGCAHLHGGEAELADDIRTRLTRLGMNLRTAFAGTPDAAHALARFGSGAGEDVRPLPVEALELEAEPIIALRRAGLVTIGDLAIRPMAGFAARFGMTAATRRFAACSATRPGRSTPAAIRRQSSSSAASPSRSRMLKMRSRSSANWSPRRRLSWRRAGRVAAPSPLPCSAVMASRLA